mmetsp:Transcript_2571/g.7650  ORF Transcript_2571/g.7650 Transcript_2571/m.7650 type:complete len:97 (-) Transcript_2571:25-315(-)
MGACSSRQEIEGAGEEAQSPRDDRANRIRRRTRAYRRRGIEVHVDDDDAADDGAPRSPSSRVIPCSPQTPLSDLLSRSTAPSLNADVTTSTEGWGE